MATTHLTKTKIDKLRYSKTGNKQDIHWDSQLLGFGIRVYPSEQKAFVVTYRSGGRKRIMTIGRYGVLTLQEARERAKKRLVEVLDGRDPLEAKEKSSKIPSFSDLCEAYLERHAKRRKRSWREDERRINRHLTPRWGTRRITSIKRTDVIRLHEAISETAVYEANRVLELVRCIFEKARLWYEYESENPAIGVEPNREKPRSRIITDFELPLLIQAIENEENPYIKGAVWLYLLTALRAKELLRAKWEDIDWSEPTLTIPRTKSGRVHKLPLSSYAIEKLKEIPIVEDNPYIIPGKKEGYHLVNINKPWNRIRNAVGCPDVKLHDLRRTVASMLTRQGRTTPLVAKVLNQTNERATAAYTWAQDTEVIEALEQHGETLRTIATRNAPGMKSSKLEIAA